MESRLRIIFLPKVTLINQSLADYSLNNAQSGLDMESGRHRRRKEERKEERREERSREPGEKKVKKGILKKSKSSSSSAGEYDVPNNNSASQSSGSRKTHRNLSGSCGHIDNLDFEPSYSQVKERSQRKHREVEDINIYDTPKVASVKWKEDLAAAYDIVSKGSRGGLINPSESSYYENVGFNLRNSEPTEAEGVYDFPRPRTVESLDTATVYFNDNFDDDNPTYDTPRRKDDEIIEFLHDEDIEDSEGDYDIPKMREAVLTPIEEEECQEYDVPRNNRLIRQESEENLYENQQFVNSALLEQEPMEPMEPLEQLEHLEPIYMNELQDDRSSGYRSSSSPSINSEENLYENGAVLLSSDEISSQGSHGSQVKF